MVGIGAQLGGYSLTAKLGHGGMASLFLGRRAGPGGFSRLAAVKVVHPHLAAEEKFRLMFTDEARLNTRLQHPNIVRVEDFGEADDTLYMIMEYVYGCTMAELLQRLTDSSQRLTVPLAIWIVMQVADALHAAHEATDEAGRPWNIVHRDVSPQNVLLSYQGYVKLIDFGIAKARYRAHVTKTGGVKGKLRYMAPEQAHARPIDRRIDVYALGVVAWEMLTMRRAIEPGPPLALLRQIQEPNIPRAATLADVPAGVDDVVARAMSPDPDTRYPSARAFRRALAQVCPEALASEHADLAALLERSVSRPPPAGVDASDFAILLPEVASPQTVPLEDAGWEPAEDQSIEELSGPELDALEIADAPRFAEPDDDVVTSGAAAFRMSPSDPSGSSASGSSASASSVSASSVSASSVSADMRRSDTRGSGGSASDPSASGPDVSASTAGAPIDSGSSASGPHAHPSDARPADASASPSDVGDLLTRMSDEARGARSVKDTLEESRQDVLDRMSADTPGESTDEHASPPDGDHDTDVVMAPPDRESTTDPSVPPARHQRNIATIELRRPPPSPSSTPPWVLYGVVAGLVGIAVVLVLLVALRALL